MSDTYNFNCDWSAVMFDLTGNFKLDLGSVSQCLRANKINTKKYLSVWY